MSDDAYDAAVGATLILALAELPEGQRDAVISRHIRGETLAKIAARRGVTSQAIQIADRKGCAKLAVSLAPLHRELLAA